MVAINDIAAASLSQRYCKAEFYFCLGGSLAIELLLNTQQELVVWNYEQRTDFGCVEVWAEA